MPRQSVSRVIALILAVLLLSSLCACSEGWEQLTAGPNTEAPPPSGDGDDDVPQEVPQEAPQEVPQEAPQEVPQEAPQEDPEEPEVRQTEDLRLYIPAVESARAVGGLETLGMGLLYDLDGDGVRELILFYENFLEMVQLLHIYSQQDGALVEVLPETKIVSTVVSGHGSVTLAENDGELFLLVRSTANSEFGSSDETRVLRPGDFQQVRKLDGKEAYEDYCLHANVIALMWDAGFSSSEEVARIVDPLPHYGVVWIISSGGNGIQYRGSVMGLDELQHTLEAAEAPTPASDRIPGADEVKEALLAHYANPQERELYTIFDSETTETDEVWKFTLRRRSDAGNYIFQTLITVDKQTGMAWSLFGDDPWQVWDPVTCRIL